MKSNVKIYNKGNLDTKVLYHGGNESNIKLYKGGQTYETGLFYQVMFKSNDDTMGLVTCKEPPSPLGYEIAYDLRIVDNKIVYEYDYNNIIAEAVPNSSSYEFSHWEINGETPQGTMVIVTRDLEIKAVFEQANIIRLISNSGVKFLNQENDVYINTISNYEGGDFQFNPHPGDSYQLLSIFQNGGPTYNISAEFDANEYYMYSLTIDGEEFITQTSRPFSVELTPGYHEIAIEIKQPQWEYVPLTSEISDVISQNIIQSDSNCIGRGASHVNEFNYAFYDTLSGVLLGLNFGTAYIWNPETGSGEPVFKFNAFTLYGSGPLYGTIKEIGDCFEDKKLEDFLGPLVYYFRQGNSSNLENAIMNSQDFRIIDDFCDYILDHVN